jgi:hypothetical protein
MAKATQTRPAPKPAARPDPKPDPKAIAKTESKPPQSLPDSSELMKEMEGDAGMGVSTRPSDNITPSIKLLQPMSPEVLAGGDRVEGAEAGDFLLADTLEVIKGDEGFDFQPVAMTEWWFEFIPRDRGGGFVARYPVERDETRDIIIPPPGAVQNPENKNQYYFEETENNCVYYRFVPGILWRNGEGVEYVIPFTSTGHTVVRSWNTKWMRQRFKTGKIMPAFANIYHLSTIMKTNNKGSWHMIAISQPHLLSTMEEVVGDPVMAYRLGKALALAFASGEKMESTDVMDAATDAAVNQAAYGGGGGEQQQGDDLPY